MFTLNTKSTNCILVSRTTTQCALSVATILFAVFAYAQEGENNLVSLHGQLFGSTRCINQVTISNNNLENFQSDSSGAFTVPNVSSGAQYNLTPSKEDCEFMPPYTSGTASSDSNIYFFAYDKVYEIKGSVTGDANCIEGASVKLQIALKSGNQGTIGEVFTDSTGAFSDGWYDITLTNDYTATISKDGCVYSPSVIQGMFGDNNSLIFVGTDLTKNDLPIPQPTLGPPQVSFSCSANDISGMKLQVAKAGKESIRLSRFVGRKLASKILKSRSKDRKTRLIKKKVKAIDALIKDNKSLMASLPESVLVCAVELKCGTRDLSTERAKYLKNVKKAYVLAKSIINATNHSKDKAIGKKMKKAKKLVGQVRNLISGIPSSTAICN